MDIMIQLTSKENERRVNGLRLRILPFKIGGY